MDDRLAPLHLWEYGMNDIPCQWDMEMCEKRFVNREQLMLHYIEDHRGITVNKIPLILRLHGVNEASMALHLEMQRGFGDVPCYKEGPIIERFKKEP